MVRQVKAKLEADAGSGWSVRIKYQMSYDTNTGLTWCLDRRIFRIQLIMAPIVLKLIAFAEELERSFIGESQTIRVVDIDQILVSGTFCSSSC